MNERQASLRVEKAESAGHRSLPETIASAAADPVGRDTFGSYLWQVKLAVREWLGLLSANSDVQAIICDHVEDIVIVRGNGARFVQLKTRARGSWSFAKICGDESGLESLVRAYRIVREARIPASCSYELWLEGPISGGKELSEFCADARRAPKYVRDRLRGMGLSPREVTDFLRILQIRPNQPAKQHVDDVIVRYIGFLWQWMSYAEVSALYRSLLIAASYAQAGEDRWWATPNALKPAIEPRHSESDSYVLPAHVLTRAELGDLSPPLASATAEDILQRVERDPTVSALELKLRAGGASSETIAELKDLRAQADTQQQLYLASRSDATSILDALSARVLQHGNAKLRQARLAAGANPSIAARPAEWVATELMLDTSNMAALDRKAIFEGQGEMVLGHLSHLSDLCRFPWRPS